MPDASTHDNGQPINPVAILDERFRAAIAAAFPEVDHADTLITPSRQAKLGDFQSNAAMPLAKRVGMKPRDVAAKIVEHLDLTGVAEPVGPDAIAGPGFINVRLATETLDRLLAGLDGDGLGLPAPAEPRTIVVDVCGVNLAKQMHVGHLRSSVIGDTIARVFERLGWNVIRQNHVGDWGLPIAMVTAKLIAERDAGRLDLGTVTLDDLDRMYRAAQSECKADRRGLEAARKWDMGPKAIAELEEQVAGAEEKLAHAKATLVKLQSGDADVAAVWERIERTTMTECLHLCERLHTRITADAAAGESSYRAELAEVVADLEARGIAEESDGALVVRVEGIAEPCLIRKRDGGFLYATTDIAAIRRRVQQLGGDEVVYCVDARQSLHFRQVFGAALKAGYAEKEGEPARLEHAAFGTVLGEDNKPLKTRSGENVKLSALLDEAVQRATDVLDERESEFDAAERQQIAEGVAIAAIKYADLSIERVKDYVFSFDRMLAFEGNTGPYLLFALTRIRSVFRRAAEAGASAGAFAIREPEEKTLALALLRYPETVRATAESLEPHRLCAYLYDLSTAFSSFYTNCPILRAPDGDAKAARLALTGLTGRVLADGLDTLGLPTVERM